MARRAARQKETAMSHEDQGRRPTGPGGGQYLPISHNPSPVSLPAGRDRFPHPDAKYPHPMECWPEGVEEPASIELGTTVQSLGGYSQSWNHDPQNEQFADLPAVTVTMANGATLVLRQLNEDDFPETEAHLEGDWEAYTGGDKFTADEILSTASETLSQSR